LRGVAILLVVIYHAFPQLLPSGFIGVDIFFVISGYLISEIILRDLKNNEFSFWNFYARRARRLFPTLILLFLTLFLFGWFAMNATEYSQLGKHVERGSFFVANFTFLNELGYFDTAAIRKPLLHLWSLSIEEQFYLFWPLALWIGHKLNVKLLWLTAVLLTGSVIFSFLQTVDANFYLPQARMWELLTGVLMAHLQGLPGLRSPLVIMRSQE
jgi:peptidoglycan/LPS O-acetylase OafA/YrhL